MNPTDQARKYYMNITQFWTWTHNLCFRKRSKETRAKEKQETTADGQAGRAKRKRPKPDTRGA